MNVFSMTKQPPPVREHKLELREVLEAMVQDGLVKPQPARDALVKAEAGGDARHPLSIAAAQLWDNPHAPGRKLTLDTLVQWLAQRSGVPYQRIDPLKIDAGRVTAVVPHAYASRLKILPVKVTSTDVTIAVCEPFEREWEKELAPILKRKIHRVLSSPEDIQRYLVEFYAIARSVKASEEQRKFVASSGVQNLEQLMELGRAGKLTADDQHVVAIVDWLLQYAFEQRASDIHLEPRRDTGNVRFRIDGVLHEVYQMPASVMVPVTSRIKIVSRMDVAEKRKPQDGRIKTRNPEGKEIELRVSALPTAFGEKLVLRIFDPDVLVKNFAALGFENRDEALWREMIAQPNGIILVTGPTGSGKTTTLYSTLKSLATPDVNVCTIEEPIELVEPLFNQMQVNPAIDLNFADGVRALLRQDPDIIMVGEIRDLETAEVAIQASLTGHLVLSTLHTNDSISAITRMLDLGVPAYLLKATLIGVVAQRLVRTLCKHCKKPVPVNDGQWQEWTQGAPVPMPRHICEPVGCLECRETGYLGRAGIYEMLRITPDVSSAIRAEVDLGALRDLGTRQGMRTLRHAGMEKVAAGLTSVAEVMSLTAAVSQ
jgi:general secretion pathway protein E